MVAERPLPGQVRVANSACCRSAAWPHTGPLGSASILEVVTNYVATANLLSCCEALVTAKAAGMDSILAPGFPARMIDDEPRYQATR